MNVVKTYNSLSGNVYRHQIRSLANEAKRQGYANMAIELFSILSQNPNVTVFEIEELEPYVDYLPESTLAGLELDPYNEDEGLGKFDINSVYDRLNDIILEAIKEHGDAPWRKTWEAIGKAINYTTKKPYRGINVMLLNHVYPVKIDNYKHPYWLTFKQAESIGAKIKKGSKSNEIFFYNFTYSYTGKGLSFKTSDYSKFKRWLTKNSARIGISSSEISSFAMSRRFAYLKSYRVFNVAQLEGIEIKKIKAATPPIENFSINEIAELIISHYPPKKPLYKESGTKAFYRPSTDLVNMPPRKHFHSEEEFYSTYFHEYVHSTGSNGRISRLKGGGMKGKAYAAEELVAEIGALYLAGEAGFIYTTVKNSATYIKGWSTRLTKEITKDNKYFIRACSEAQKAVDYILNLDKNGNPKYYKNLEKKVISKPKKQVRTPGKKTPVKRKKKEPAQMALFGAAKNLAGLGFVSASETPEIETFVVPGEIGKFLQTIQAYKELILIKGTKHTSKSQLAMQIANAFGELKMPVGYIDQEQGGMSSKDTLDSRDRNTSEKGRPFIFIKGDLENPLQELEQYCQYFKVMVADSVTELGISADELNYLRTKYPGVIWIFISQVKENGAMYGGNKMAHNPTKIIECHPNVDPKKRYASLEKNRGNNLDVFYSMYDQKIIPNPNPQIEQ